MKKLIISLFVILIISSNISAKEKWDKWDKTLFGTYTFSTAIDCLQTRYIFDNPKKFREKNRVIKYAVKKTGRGSIPVYFVALNLINYTIADHLKPIYIGNFKIPTRKIYLIGINIFSYDTVYKNYNIKIKIPF